MRIASIDRVDYPRGIEQLPLEVKQHGKHLSAVVLTALSLAAMAALLTPVVLIANDLLQHPDAVGQIADRPISTLILATGMVMALAILVIPLRSGLSGFGRRRSVLVTADSIKIKDRGLTGERRRSVPLSQFCGVTHHIRATLSGPRHEIILVHRDPSGDVLLHIATRQPDVGADHFARMLGLAEMPARAFYGRRRSLPAANEDVAIQSAAA